MNINDWLTDERAQEVVEKTEHNYLIEQKQSNTLKIKVLSLYEEIPKQILNPSPDPKNNPLGPEKVKNDPKFKSKSKVRIKEAIENKDCSTT